MGAWVNCSQCQQFSGNVPAFSFPAVRGRKSSTARRVTRTSRSGCLLWRWRGWGPDVTHLSMTGSHSESQYPACCFLAGAKLCLNSRNCCGHSRHHNVFSVWQFVETFFWDWHIFFCLSQKISNELLKAPECSLTCLLCVLPSDTRAAPVGGK